MRTPALLIAIALLAACGKDAPPPQAKDLPSLDQKPAAPPKAPEQKAEGENTGDPSDIAALENAEPQQPEKQPGSDPCDLRGYDMNKMTVEEHEMHVKQCARSKE